MPVTIAAIANCDDAVVFWRVDTTIKDCWGFAVEREQKRDDGTIARTVLENRTGFARDEPKSGDKRLSTDWPFQRFSWADHSVNSGDRVRYRVVPMVHDGTALQQDVAERSEWTKWLELSGDAGNKTAAFFNRGLVISQFMARYLERLRLEHGLDSRLDALKKFKEDLDEHERPIRVFLSGILRTELLALLEKARKAKGHVFGALYELEDDELVTALEKLGARGHLVLANGSIQAKTGETAAQARKRDQNKAARTRLKAKKLEIHDRMVSPGALGHNKFLVVTDTKQNPRAVWTGSTNWTKTGLCTQINNALLIQNAEFAQAFFDQWERLRDAKSAFPEKLVTDNSDAKPVTVGKSKADVWFSRTRGKADLEALDDVVNGAEEAVLFLMFQPGGAATLASIRKRLETPGKLYVKGVVSTLPPEDIENPDHVDVAVVGDGKKYRVGLDIVQPQGIKRPFASWAATVTRNEFIPMQGGVVGFAIVHSKLIVVDPFTKPVVVTGSHNFSGSASTKNDENFVIVRKNTDLAVEYAANILAIHQHYRWLSFVHDQQKRGKNPKAYLVESDEWQGRHLKGAAKREMQFWAR
jgi:phosphatidylserine/phosphatidylglycerophosphate/cardiolipin synthase-like enzyme